VRPEAEAVDTRRSLRPVPVQRRFSLLALGVAVLAIHLWLADRSLPDHLGSGDAEPAFRRIEVAFVQELVPQAPPAAPAALTRPNSRPRLAASVPTAEPVEPAASAPASPPLVPEQPVAVADAGPGAMAQQAEQQPVPVSAPASAAVGAAPAQPASAPAFEWPPSTRLSYTLTGDYQGPVQGQAQVEWLRSGTRYQVELVVSVGPSFAPVLSRKIRSEGEITAQGLEPGRYDEETRVLWREPRRLTIALGADQVRLPGGTALPRPAGVQDSASQFVQMTWLFTTRPELLQAGQSVELPLALPRRVEAWTYDVQQTETLYTPTGAVEAVHVKPRRPGRQGDLTAELWVAPSLQYLPVRFVIRQDAETYIDLLIDRLPQQALQPQPGK
jgi:Protein of unknown function (DUF3108)